VALTALAAVSPLDEGVFRDALAAARAIEAHHVRAAALARLVHLVDEPERSRVADEALDAARRVFEEGHPAEQLWRQYGGLAFALNDLASVVSALGADHAEALANRVIESARLLPEHLANEQAGVLATVADSFDEPDRSELRAEAVAAARSDALRFNPETVLRVAPPGLRAAAITDALAEARKNDGYTIWREIASALLDMSAKDAYSLAANRPSGLTTLARKNVLTEIRYLAPVIDALGRDAIGEIATAIEDCGRWWP
jgi:hypothetical protein